MNGQEFPVQQPKSQIAATQGTIGTQIQGRDLPENAPKFVREESQNYRRQPVDIMFSRAPARDNVIVGNSFRQSPRPTAQPPIQKTNSANWVKNTLGINVKGKRSKKHTFW